MTFIHTRSLAPEQKKETRTTTTKIFSTLQQTIFLAAENWVGFLVSDLVSVCMDNVTDSPFCCCCCRHSSWCYYELIVVIVLTLIEILPLLGPG